MLGPVNCDSIYIFFSWEHLSLIGLYEVEFPGIRGYDINLVTPLHKSPGEIGIDMLCAPDLGKKVIHDNKNLH